MLQLSIAAEVIDCSAYISRAGCLASLVVKIVRIAVNLLSAANIVAVFVAIKSCSAIVNPAGLPHGGLVWS